MGVETLYWPMEKWLGSPWEKALTGGSGTQLWCCEAPPGKLITAWCLVCSGQSLTSHPDSAGLPPALGGGGRRPSGTCGIGGCETVKQQAPSNCSATAETIPTWKKAGAAVQPCTQASGTGRNSRGSPRGQHGRPPCILHSDSVMAQLDLKEQAMEQVQVEGAHEKIKKEETQRTDMVPMLPK